MIERLRKLLKILRLRREFNRIARRLEESIPAPRKPAHTDTVAAIAVRIARAMRLPKPEVEKVRTAAVLHDVGKIGIPSSILLKPGPLTDEEWEVMRRHPVMGAEILQPVKLLSGVAEIVKHHHEHYDGSGYPDGLKGEDIPLASRIILVADAFVMITSDVPWRQARSRSEALRELREHTGGQFDPKVVKVFESMIDRI